MREVNKTLSDDDRRKNAQELIMKLSKYMDLDEDEDEDDDDEDYLVESENI